jgi:hypothetical protein
MQKYVVKELSSAKIGVILRLLSGLSSLNLHNRSSQPAFRICGPLLNWRVAFFLIALFFAFLSVDLADFLTPFSFTDFAMRMLSTRLG